MAPQGLPWCVPEISRFFGIIIRMFAELGAPRHVPHFHAYYQRDAAVFGFDPVELIAGSLPRRQRRLVEARAELHQAAVAADWTELQEGRRPAPVEPLR
jgi:nucleotide-binding universal stress UspA family protein